MLVELRDFLSQLNIFFSAMCVAPCMCGVYVWLRSTMSVSAIGNHDFFSLCDSIGFLCQAIFESLCFFVLVLFSLDFDGYFHNKLRSSCTAQHNFIVGTKHPTIGKLLCLICYNTTQRPYYMKVICYFFLFLVETVALFKLKWIYMPISCCYDL